MRCSFCFALDAIQYLSQGRTNMQAAIQQQTTTNHQATIHHQPTISNQGAIKHYNNIKYNSETKTVPFMGKTITIENLTPILTPKERERRKKDIERTLYNVFVKYSGGGGR